MELEKLKVHQEEEICKMVKATLKKRKNKETIIKL